MDGLTLADMFASGKAAQLKPMQKQGLLIQMGKAMDAFHREIHKSHASLAPELIFISSKRGVRVMMISWHYVVDDYFDLMPSKPTYRQYQAPEGFVDPQPTSLRSDVYAFAALAYQLYADKPAFLPDDDEKARFQRELKAPNSLSAKQWSALQSALNPDQQSDRHPYLSCSKHFSVKKKILQPIRLKMHTLPPHRWINQTVLSTLFPESKN